VSRWRPVRSCFPTGLLVAAALLCAPGPARAEETEGGTWLSPAWPFAALALNTGLTAGTAVAAGWPVDDAMLRYGVGLAAGAAPGALLLWLWGTPCGGRDERDSLASCWVEAALQAFVVAVLDGGAMFTTMLFVKDVPASVQTPGAGLTAGWITGWATGTTVALVLPPLLGAGWGEDVWSLVGLMGWTHGALATTLLAAVYAILGHGPESGWSVQLPIVATRW